MTGFDLCAGKKADRGTFSITIDGVQSGSGSEQGVNTQEGACEVVASVRNLSGGSHSVVLANSGSTYASDQTSFARSSAKISVVVCSSP